ncbi:hypothetical protein ACFE04_006311 [Oxalis oulophora]
MKKSTTFLMNVLRYSSEHDSHLTPSQHRSISSTTSLHSSWVNKIKGVFTGEKTQDQQQPQDSVPAASFTLLRFAEELSKARKLGKFGQFIVGRSSAATFNDAFEKQEAIIRLLGGFDITGENLQTSQKQEAAKRCNCTIADVENALAKFTWAREANNKMAKLKEEGKPMPKNMAEVQKLVGLSPLDMARANLAKSGQISRNAMCPCGSNKRYKRYLYLHFSSLLSMVLWERLNLEKFGRAYCASPLTGEECAEIIHVLFVFLSIFLSIAVFLSIFLSIAVMLQGMLIISR